MERRGTRSSLMPVPVCSAPVRAVPWCAGAPPLLSLSGHGLRKLQSLALPLPSPSCCCGATSTSVEYEQRAAPQPPGTVLHPSHGVLAVTSAWCVCTCGVALPTARRVEHSSRQGAAVTHSRTGTSVVYSRTVSTHTHTHTHKEGEEAGGQLTPGMRQPYADAPACTTARRCGIALQLSLHHRQPAPPHSPSAPRPCECGGGCDHQQLAAPPCIPLWRESLCRSHYDSV